MKQLYNLGLLGLFWMGVTLNAFAQLPPNQPEQDCINALSVCQNVFTQTNSYQGEGLNPNEIDSGPSCLGSGELNDTWYIFTVQVSGNLAFSITPQNGSNDYDWAVYNLTTASCGDIFTNPALEVSCNFSGNVGCGGVTGPNGQTTGPCSGQNEPVIPVLAGETYVVNVSNFSSSANGYSLDFSASTAVIFDNQPPQMNALVTACGSTTIGVNFSENILCSSVQPSDFTVIGPGGPYTVTAVIGAACQAGGTFENAFQLTTTPLITQAGNFTIILSDSVEDNCGNIGINDTLTTFIGITGGTAIASPAVICAGQSTTLSSSFANQPGYTFLWSPGNLTGGSITVSPTTTTTYTVSATDGAGCASAATVTVTVKPLPLPQFINPLTACAGQPATINYTGNANLLATYIWDFDNPSIVLGNGPGPYQVTWNTTGPKTITLSVIDNGCAGPSGSATLDVLLVPTADFTGPASVCPGDTAIYTYQGNAGTGAVFSWSFPGAAYVENMSAPTSTIGPYKVVWSTSGNRNVCLQVNNQGCTSSVNCRNTTVNIRPDINIVPEANQCFSGNSFSFSTTGGTADVYQWNFGASAVPAQSNQAVPPLVSYVNPGVKTVSLVTIKDGCVSDSSIISFEVVQEPVAAINVSSNTTCTDSCVTFSYGGTVAGPTQSFQWDFGPGAIPQTSGQANPPCVEYVTGGVKQVILTVSYKGCTKAVIQGVTVNAGPIVSAGPDKAFCEGDGGVQLTAQTSGGTQPYFYQWISEIGANGGLSDPNTEDPTANPNAPSPTDTIAYYYQVTDVNGCRSGVDTVEVIVKAKPRMDAGPDQVICPKDAPGVFLQGGLAADNAAPQPITYQWTPASGLNNPNTINPYARPDTTTIYTLRGVSVNGCQSNATTLDTLSTVEVRVNPKPVAFAGRDTVLCLGDSIRLQGFAAGAGPGYSYSWTPAVPGTITGATTATPWIRPLVSTTYTLVVSSGGCDSDGDQIRVTVETIPTVSAGQDEVICYRDSVQLSGLASGDPDGVLYSYQWTPAAGLSDPTSGTPLAGPAVTTQYLVVASSPFGCGSARDSVLVTVEPTPEAQ
ncbi:MAG: hypothetical protein SF053_12965, partial [Bacteroidia bacterium]|nr:hypothetical protein [Bacteroidia bacterium]